MAGDGPEDISGDQRLQDGIQQMCTRDTLSQAMVKRCEEVLASKDVEQLPVLPFDIVADILSRLSVKTLLTFRCVCKQWCSLIHDPGFVKEQHNRAFDRPVAMLSQTSFDQEISLYYFGDDGEEIKDSSFCGDLRARSFYFLSNAVNGLVCVYDPTESDPGDMYLLNPSTRQLAKLPRSRFHGRRFRGISVGLAFDVSRGEYKVVRLFCAQDHDMCSCGCEVLTVGSREWRYVGDVEGGSASREAHFVRGALHWLTIEYPGPYGPDSAAPSVLVFDVKEEKFWLMPPPQPGRTFNMIYMSLTVFGGRLCFVERPSSPPPPEHPTPAPALLKIWGLRDYESHKWAEEYALELSSLGRIFIFLDILGFKGQEILFRGEQEREKCAGLAQDRLWVINSFDMGSRTVRCLCDQVAHRLALFTESLISPRELIS